MYFFEKVPKFRRNIRLNIGFEGLAKQETGGKESRGNPTFQRNMLYPLSFSWLKNKTKKPTRIPLWEPVICVKPLQEWYASRGQPARFLSLFVRFL
jgi:hypothetical protein